MALFSISFFPASPVVVPRVAQCRRSHRYIYVDYSRLIVRHSVFIVFSLYFWFDTSCDPCKVKLYFLVTDNYLINTNGSLTLTHVGIKPCPRAVIHVSVYIDKPFNGAKVKQQQKARKGLIVLQQRNKDRSSKAWQCFAQSDSY